MSARSRNQGKTLHNTNMKKVSDYYNRKEVRDTVRESRQGYRATGMLQLTRYYASEGVMVVDLGGPPVVGA